MANEASYPRRSVELLWGTRERSSRGPKPGLSLDQIVDSAISLADAHGIDALSMRRVAAALGVGTMSLYRYVPGKAELLDLMLDKLSDGTDQIAQAEGKDWRGVLEMTARGSFQLYLAHPWLLQVNWTRPVLGPNTLAGVEFAITGLDGLGLTDQQRVMVLVMIDAFVVGLARQWVLHGRVIDETGVSDEEFWAQQVPTLERALCTGDYPTMAALSEDAFGAGWAETFEFGLQRLLDGIEALVAPRGPA